MLTDKNGRALAIRDHVTLDAQIVDIRTDVPGGMLYLQPVAGPGLTAGQLVVGPNVVSVVEPEAPAKETEEDPAA